MPVPTVPLLRPLYPEATDQGDLFILAVPEAAGARFRNYVYTTGGDLAAGGAFPVYASDDLATWKRLPDALGTGVVAAHWAPCVVYLAELERPYVMLYSRAVGLGEEAHVGHVIRRADSTAPEGPFVDTGHELTADLDFAIDPDIYRAADGTLRIAFARDFDQDEPYGTGIGEAPISADLTRIVGPTRVLARPRFDWQVYDPARVMPWKIIPGWIERPAGCSGTRSRLRSGGLTAPDGGPVYLYSGGCFWGYYAVGALVRDAAGEPVDVTDGERGFVIRPRPEDGFYAPGHCSWLRLPSGEEYLMLHARFGSADAPRPMCLARLRWTEAGLPEGAW